MTDDDVPPEMVEAALAWVNEHLVDRTLSPTDLFAEGQLELLLRAALAARNQP